MDLFYNSNYSLKEAAHFLVFFLLKTEATKLSKKKKVTSYATKKKKIVFNHVKYQKNKEKSTSNFFRS